MFFSFQVKALKHEHIVQVSGGEHFSLALTADRKRLYSFGRGDYGQLGIGVMGTGEFEANPVLVAFPKAVVITDVEAGPLHAMAISETHEVYTWGFNTQGNTGHTTLDDEDVYRPLNLDLMTYLNSDNKLGGCHVHGVSGGTQHALMLVRRYRPRKS